MVFNWFKRLFYVFLGFGVTTRAVPDPFLGPETRLPDWYPAQQSLHGSVPTDPDPDPSFELFSGIRVPVKTDRLPSFFSIIFSIVV